MTNSFFLLKPYTGIIWAQEIRNTACVQKLLGNMQCKEFATSCPEAAVGLTIRRIFCA